MKRIVYVVLAAAIIEWALEQVVPGMHNFGGELLGNIISTIIITAFVAHHVYTRKR